MLDPKIIDEDVCRFLAEDVGSGDLTALVIPEDKLAKATILTREAMLVCGQAWVNAVFKKLDEKVVIDWQFKEGEQAYAGDTLCYLSGSARALLTGERAALNMLQTLSATASLAKQFAKAVEGTSATVLDTRKTIPGLRLAQKYAVRCGGASNHRVGLYDGMLIKENHIMAAGSIAKAVAAARLSSSLVDVEVEVENLDEVKQALEAKADILLLDNFTLEQLREAVELNKGVAKLEASGNVNLSTIRDIAKTGVDFISVGALTKNIQAVDLSMRVDLEA
ncbi:MAG: nicotinate-nucleotide pyrophosphorylase (carboxylating) [Cycloclasticus pugetii]|jgi:nicotinate-nucleotide pyrophosphorylase (carboxylating)|uniref:Probable nicotinate-nucleotide pyrophosphorylase [carboxylating] n=1 Tax=Cycloclasticus zancles 78-ME TaxID=1198232 RepID=S5T9F2_9GAMM|nr:MULTISPECIES: carboxylating nicotinate-nucleotide diphosphorylase [Cycloclasticus]AGS40346.1 Nicotinate-nucleotide pyrophosphorylase (carboxylating) [Cycloclasticus zancles 78-ME]MBV1899698.1 carboxylating nicotinate-nucleotide diphosphorylase [Cycloclasticus sp.]MDF1828618.1 carboxylating nicotinate-nucleotide diphosphorylase [Cycloclasticus pugetii]|tara:strand:+ start:2969 stop:3805 length:837 start_codon:yes stop_codon:yes gene_type:complete